LIDMKEEERNNLVNMLGKELARHMDGFFGKVNFNIQNGKYVNCNIEQSIKPEKQEK